METLRMITANSTPVNGTVNTGTAGQAGNVNQAGANGNSSFTQTLVHVMQDGSGTTAFNPLTGTLMPGLLVGTVAELQQPAQDAAGSLLQLLTQLLNGEQIANQSSDAESSSEDNLDFNSALPQLQLLLLQLITSQGNDSANSDGSGADQASVAELGNKLGATANELLQTITSIMQEQSKPSEMKASVMNLMETLKPLLIQASTVSQLNQAVQNEQSSTSGVQQAVPYLNSGEAYRSIIRKPLKEQATTTATTVQPLVHIVNDGRGNTGLNLLAAKAVLQAPIAQATISTTAAGSDANSEIPLEAITNSASSDDATNQAVFRLAGSAENITKGEAPVISANRFAQEMSQLLKSMNLQSAGGQSFIKITLMPEHLGQVDVRMSMQNGQLVAQFVADSMHGKDLLESQLPQLRAALQGQGLQVERLEVTQSQESAFAMFQDQRQQQSSQQFNRKQQGQGKNGEDLPIDFDAELAVLAARKAALAGSSFDVSA